MKKDIITGNLIKYSKMLADEGFTSSGFLAVKADGGMYVTKPFAMADGLTEDGIEFVTDQSIEELEGNFRAAAVLLLCALRSDKKVGAAAIADSEPIVRFSSKRMTLKPVLDDMAQIDGISVRSAKDTTASAAVAALSGMRNACFLPDAGALVTGRTLDEVYTASLVLDKAANCYLLAEPKGGAEALNVVLAVAEHLIYKIKYSKKNQKSQQAAEKGETPAADTAERPSAIVTPEQKKLAEEVKAAGVRLLEENLVQGTWGNIAVRLDEKHMLATPSALDYVMLQPSQMAIVDLDTMEWQGSNKPTSERGIHAALLKAHPESNATVHTHPVYGSILSSMNKPLEVPEKYREILGDVIPVSKYGPPGTGMLVKNTVTAIGDAPACFMVHHGVIVRGKDLDDAFVICRALEDACKDYLLG